jgi:acetyltransferase-like isoleucine patch superfamily enzyme
MFKLLLLKVRNRFNLLLSKAYLPGTLSSYKQKNLIIGKNVSFGDNVLLRGNATITIGNNTMIAYGLIINTSTHDYNPHPMWAKRIELPVKIGYNVWMRLISLKNRYNLWG